MKRRIALLALLLAPVPACMPGWPPPAEISDAAYESTSPLRARLQTGTVGLAVNVSHPAHVAVFEIVPGRGLGLLYPAYGSERGQFSSGYSRIHLNRFRPYTWHYTGGTFDDRTGPRYYLLVASRSPLRLAQFQDDPAALRQHFGFRRFAALNPRPAMEELVDLVVPAQADDDWDTDLITVWPQEWRGLDDRRTVRVVCENGYVVTTEWENAQHACGLVNRMPPRVPPQRPDTAGEERPDSVQVPGRRRPQPRSADDEEGQARPRERARIERWREADGSSFSSDGRSRPRPVERGDGEERTPPVRRAPPAPTEHEPQTREGGRREGPGGRREMPQWETPREMPRAEPRHEAPRPEPRREAPRAEPRHEAPRPEPRREAPREAPRAEPRREAPRVEAPRPSAPETPPARTASGGETR